MTRVGTPKRSRPALAHRTCERCHITRSVDHYIGRGGTYANICHDCLPPRRQHVTGRSRYIDSLVVPPRMSVERGDGTDAREPATLEYLTQRRDRQTGGTWYELR